MSTITGKEFNYGLKFDAYSEMKIYKGQSGGCTTDEQLGALDAPGCIPCGSSVPSENLQGQSAISVTVRSTGARTDVNQAELL